MSAQAESARPPLTQLAHAAWRPFLRPGAWAVDATAGNGHDTAFLAGAVGPHGRVFAVDIQPAAIEATGRLLDRHGLSGPVTRLCGDHAQLAALLPAAARGRLALVCLNLGYRPAGDHRVATRADTTLAALRAALELLDGAGALSVVAYRGHPGALAEEAAVAGFFAALPPPWRCIRAVATGGARPGPVWRLAAAGDPTAG